MIRSVTDLARVAGSVSIRFSVVIAPLLCVRCDGIRDVEIGSRRVGVCPQRCLSKWELGYGSPAWIRKVGDGMADLRDRPEFRFGRRAHAADDFDGDEAGVGV